MGRWIIRACAAAATLWATRGATVATAAADEGVQLGSYGRVVVGTDLRGGAPEPVAAVAHPPRIIEPTYLELDLYSEQDGLRDIELRTVVTIAFGDRLFHDTGEFDAAIALRNLYAEAVIAERLGVWIGSRMYRGDDIYLLDWWPLDDVNTVGAGAWWLRDRLLVRGHLGVNRLDDPFQLQVVEVPAPQLGTAESEQLDRQRFIATASGSYRVWGDATGPAVKAKLYADVQGIDDGQRRRDDDTVQKLPRDYGFTAGAQLGAWGGGPHHSHANLFLRYARGLAAFDELAIPTGLDENLQAFPSADELVIAASAGYELPLGGVLLGAYARRFVDADPNADDLDDGWEYAIDVRPYASVLEVLQLGIDLSYQRRFPRGASPTALEVLEPAIVQIAPMLAFSPRGPGPLDRPQYRVVYRAAHLNDGAREAFALEDPRRSRTWHYFLGAQVEWWFNSSTHE